MKTRLMNIITGICTLALALTPIFHYKGSCIIFFGEPEFPTNNKTM